MSASSAARVPRKQPKRDFFTVIKKDLPHLTRKSPKEANCGVSGVPQHAMLIYLVGETFGAAYGSTPPLYVCISHKKFAEEGGCSIRQAVDILADAEKRKLIESIDLKQAKELGLVGPKHKGHPQAKWYRALPENWATAPKYSPPKPKLIVMESLNDEPGEDDDDDQGSQTPQVERAAVVQVSPDQPLVLMPGAKSRPVPWVSKATKYSFDCSGVTVPLSIERECCFGVVKFKIRDSNQQVAANSQNAKGRRIGEPPMKPSSQVNPRVSAGMAELTAAVGRYCIPDDDAIPLLVRACRKVNLHCTAAEIAYFVDQVGPRAAKAETPVGLLVTAVPAYLKGPSLEACRKALKGRDEQIRRAEEVMTAQTLEAAKAFLEADPKDPLVTKEDREWARQILKA